MTEEQKAAVINARAATAMIRALGMQAANDQRKHRGEAMAFDQVDFDNVIQEEELHWNAIHGLLYQW
jgi:hypothetical protein